MGEFRLARGRSCALAAIASLLTLAACAGGPAASAATRKAMWGPAFLNGVSQFPVYRELGVTIYEDDLHWNQIAVRRPAHPRNPADRAYRWPGEVSAALAEAKHFHMRVALQIIGSPAWSNGGRGPRWAPHKTHDFAAFATAAAKRYPTVHLWMIWGEPSRFHNFRPLTPARPFARLTPHQRIAPHLYSRMLDAAYGALKAVSRANIVIGGMTDSAASISTPQWIENMRMPDGRPPRLDLYGHNPFSIRAPMLGNLPSPEQQVDFSDLGRLSTLVAENLGRPGNPRPGLFLSEWTIPTAPDLEFNFYVDLSTQALWIKDAFGVAAALKDVYAIGWIHLYDEPPRSAGGLIKADGKRKPAFRAWQRG